LDYNAYPGGRERCLSQKKGANSTFEKGGRAALKRNLIGKKRRVRGGQAGRGERKKNRIKAAYKENNISGRRSLVEKFPVERKKVLAQRQKPDRRQKESQGQEWGWFRW